MIKKASNNRAQKHYRMRKNINGTMQRPRLSVFRSDKHIYAQIIDDVAGRTLVSASSLAMKEELAGKNKCEEAKAVGLAVGKKALEAGITEVVFDRGGYIYTGRVQKLAEGAREAGLKF